MRSFLNPLYHSLPLFFSEKKPTSTTIRDLQNPTPLFLSLHSYIYINVNAHSSELIISQYQRRIQRYHEWWISHLTYLHRFLISFIFVGFREFKLPFLCLWYQISLNLFMCFNAFVLTSLLLELLWNLYLFENSFYDLFISSKKMSGSAIFLEIVVNFLSENFPFWYALVL